MKHRKQNSKRVIAMLLGVTLAVSGLTPIYAASSSTSGQETDVVATGAVEADTHTTGQTDSTEDLNSVTSVDTSDLVAGTDSDITISNYKVSGNKAGGKVTIHFTVSANTNSSRRYTVSSIQKICPVVDESFAFETTDDAYKITNTSASSVDVTYTFTAKDNLETAYYPTSFLIVYARKSATTGTDNYKDTDYYVTKSLSVKLNAKTTTEATTTETVADDSDISLRVKTAPSGTYGQNTTVAFTAVSKTVKITGVTPVIGDSFPFETKGDAYKTITSKGVKSLDCKYSFQVRSDVATGYQSLTFAITYIKNKQTFTANRSINVKLTGKKEKTASSSGSDKASSTPRLMVTGCDTNVEKIYPNESFTLTLHLKNTSKSTLSNIKVTLNNDDVDFVPVSGVNSAFVDSVAAGATKDINFEMKAAAGLEAKVYKLTVKSEYENAKATSFSAEDVIVLPVSVKNRVTLTDIAAPDELTMGNTADLTLSINNVGGGALSNVKVMCEGDDFTCEEGYVGTIAAGATGYGTVTLTPKKITTADGACKVTVTYEDSDGETQTIEEETNVFVTEASSEELDEMMTEADNQDSHSGRTVLLILLLIVVIVAVVVILKKRKKKRLLQEEEELMDDDF